MYRLIIVGTALTAFGGGIHPYGWSGYITVLQVVGVILVTVGIAKESQV